MPEQMIRLIAPPGCQDCGVGTVRYHVDADGTVDVPASAVGPLTTVGGFAIAPAPAVEAAPSEEQAAGNAQLPSGSDIWSVPPDIVSLGDPVE